MALLIATEATLFGSLIATYFYLRFQHRHWPLGGIAKPAVVAAARLHRRCWSPPARPSSWRSGPQARRARRAWWLAGPGLRGPGNLPRPADPPLRRRSRRFRPSDNAYGSIYYILLGSITPTSQSGSLLDRWLLWQAAGGLTNYRLIALRVIAIYWYFVIAIGGRRRPHPALSVAMKVPQAILVGSRHLAGLAAPLVRGARRPGAPGSCSSASATGSPRRSAALPAAVGDLARRSGRSRSAPSPSPIAAGAAGHRGRVCRAPATITRPARPLGGSHFLAMVGWPSLRSSWRSSR